MILQKNKCKRKPGKPGDYFTSFSAPWRLNHDANREVFVQKAA